MLTFGVLTDQHFGPRATFGGKLRKLSHLAPPLTKAFAARMRDEIRPDFVVNLGDCIEDESAAVDKKRYVACLDSMREAGVELVNVAGNHDMVHLTAADLRRAWGMPEGGPLYRSFERGGLCFVVLHTREKKDCDVTLGREQLAWLEQRLGETTLPIVVLMHHSAAEQDLRGNRWFEGAPHICLVEERVALRRLLARHGRTLLVMNGHLHWNHFDLIDGIPYVTLQSLIENVDDDAPGTAAAAHAVVRIDSASLSIEVAGAQPCRYQVTRS
jgi:predicted phosphodiesterase